jgi:hypothetical protein
MGDENGNNPGFSLHANYEMQLGGSNGAGLGFGGKNIWMEFNPKTSTWFVSIGN